jgi:hypothetical protein
MLVTLDTHTGHESANMMQAVKKLALAILLPYPVVGW